MTIKNETKKMLAFNTLPLKLWQDISVYVIISILIIFSSTVCTKQFTSRAKSGSLHKQTLVCACYAPPHVGMALHSKPTSVPG